MVLLLLRLGRHAAGLADRHRAPTAVIGVHSVQCLLGADFGVELSQETRRDEARPAPPCPAVDEQDLQEWVRPTVQRRVKSETARDGEMRPRRERRSGGYGWQPLLVGICRTHFGCGEGGWHTIYSFDISTNTQGYCVRDKTAGTDPKLYEAELSKVRDRKYV